MKGTQKGQKLEGANLSLCRRASNFVERKWYIATVFTINGRVFAALKGSVPTANALLVSLDAIFVLLIIVLRSKMNN